MSSSKRPQISVQPLNYGDIAQCSQISSSAFAVDPHTIVKNLGRKPYDMYEITRTGLLQNLERRTHIYVKALTEGTDEIAGYAGWIFRGVSDPSLIPWKAPKDDKSAENGQRRDVGAGNLQPEPVDDDKLNLIDRLHALEDADMKQWLFEQVPLDVPCIFVEGVCVSPSYQSQGIGSALLRYGNNIANSLGLTTYVHSSHQAYQAYEKSGFKPMKTLKVDLDEYAPRPPRDGEHVMGKPGKWGEYTISYMKKLPRQQ